MCPPAVHIQPEAVVYRNMEGQRDTGTDTGATTEFTFHRMHLRLTLRASGLCGSMYVPAGIQGHYVQPQRRHRRRGHSHWGKELPILTDPPHSLVVLPVIWIMHLDSRLISRELKGRTRTATFTEAPAISAPMGGHTWNSSRRRPGDQTQSYSQAWRAKGPIRQTLP